jgi:plasmid stabilization system protein ParE
MKHRKVIFSRKFKESLKEYIMYLKENVSDETANHVKNGILDKCRSLSDFAGFSKELYILDEATDYRSVVKWKYLIIYKIKNDQVWILNIIHTSRHPNHRSDI